VIAARVQAVFRCKDSSGAIIFHVQRFFRCKRFSFEFPAVGVAKAAPQEKVKCRKGFTYKKLSHAKMIHLEKSFTYKSASPKAQITFAGSPAS